LKQQIDEKNAQYKKLHQEKVNLEDSLLSKGPRLQTKEDKPSEIPKQDKPQVKKAPIRGLPGPFGPTGQFTVLED
jgi:hypothetical protein